VNYGPVQALRGVNLTLHRGDRLALVGANGSGKTTLAAPAASACCRTRACGKHPPAPTAGDQ
jgi:ABC-type branched-subunit amino acid transport system ATPase component